MAHTEMKRFWKNVTVEGGAILLDGRPVKTPGRFDLVAPTSALTEAIADEWRAVDGKIDPRGIVRNQNGRRQNYRRRMALVAR